jgi:uncharacterized protein YegP (UPF0339 family)
MATFLLSKAKDGQFFFNLKAGNGQTILTSEMYKSKDSALAGIGSVQTNAPDEARYERKTSSNGKHYFVLKAANHQVIGASEMYESESSCVAGIKSVMQHAPNATTDDTTA